MTGIHDDFYLAEQSELSGAAGTNAVASLQAGHPFSLLLAEDDRQRTNALETLLDTIADPSTRFSRATNPLRARLTLERLLIQVIQGGPETLASDPAAIIRRIAERRQDESRVVLVIERAETLHPEVLRFLGRAAALFPDGVPRLQVLFVGRPEFRTLLDNPDSGFDAQTTLLEQYRPSEPEPLFVPVLPEAPEPLMQRPVPVRDDSLRMQLRSVWERGLAIKLTIMGGVLIGVAAIGFAMMLAFTASPDVTAQDSASALSELPEPGAGDPDPPVLQAGPPIDEGTAALRREFEAYLIASGKTLEGMTSAQRRATYNEFLVWRARTRPNRPAANTQ